MAEMVKVRYLGPEKIRVLRDMKTGEYHNFLVGNVVEIPRAFAEELLATMNPRNLTLEEASAYDAHLFEMVEDGGDD